MNWYNRLDLEERLNVLSHGVGIPFAIIGAFLLLERNQNQNCIAIFSICLYSLSLVSMFLISTLYHASSVLDRKRKLRILDHINIYFLIAGTYTPVVLITLINGNGWYIFSAVWGITLVGSLLKLFFTGKYEIVSLILYLIMGWLIVFDIDNLLALISNDQLIFLMLGGAFYTMGIIFYAVKKIPYNHFIWHLFVLAGALSHWLFICSLLD